ncbi:MAG: aminoacyl-tRNA deacylase [Patescibacteria group bacterium]
MSQVVFEEIIRLLQANKINYYLFEHEPVYTSEQAAKVRGSSLKGGAKALIFVADGKPIMIVVPGDKKVDIGRFKEVEKIDDLRMATPEEVVQLTGLQIGAVHPLGNLHNLPVYVDKSLGRNQEIVFNAGLHTKSIRMKYQDYFCLVKPSLGDFAI